MQRTTKSGFSLIEVMSAISVFTVMLLIITRIFGDSTRAMEVGLRQAELQSNGRAIMDFIARELSQAVCDDEVGIKVTHSNGNLDRLYFVALGNTPRYRGNGNENYRQAIQLTYYLVTESGNAVDGDYSREKLQRRGDQKQHTMAAFSRVNWWDPEPGTGEVATILDDVVELEIKLSTLAGDLKDNYDSTSDGPPLYAEVYLSTLSQDDYIRYDSLPGNKNSGPKADFLKNNEKRFFRRVYFHNVDGYNGL